MQILHGTWIPQTSEDFIQRGAFYLWVETTEKKQFHQPNQRQPNQRHPRQLVAEELALLLKQECGVQPLRPGQELKTLISPQYFLLPTVEDEPLPSLELSRYLEEELPESFDWQYWQVDCYPTLVATKSGDMVNSIVTLLNELHFLAVHNLASFQLGSDLLFWFHYTQALKRLIFKDHYIPALKYRDLQAKPAAKPKESTPTKQRSTSAASTTEPVATKSRSAKSKPASTSAKPAEAEPTKLRSTKSATTKSAEAGTTKRGSAKPKSALTTAKSANAGTTKQGSTQSKPASVQPTEPESTTSRSAKSSASTASTAKSETKKTQSAKSTASTASTAKSETKKTQSAKSTASTASTAKSETKKPRSAKPTPTPEPEPDPPSQSSTRKTSSTKTTKKTRRSANLAARTPTASVSSATRTTPTFEIYPAWEWIGEEYEATIQQYVDYMPLICVAGFAEPREAPEFYDRETLLRHFSECLLIDIVSHTPTTQAYEKTIVGSLLHSCLYSYGRSRSSPAQLEEYKQWQVWRDRIIRTQTEQPFYLGFQLQDPGKPEEPWELQLQVTAKEDLSLHVKLVDYWRMRPKQQQQVHQQFGQDFEQQLLTNLGYAARIYPALWQGLETDQPVGITLNLDQAFAFLKESAWVLENAGYKVMIPAWWTPQGRQRAKVRLKAKGKSLAGGKDKAKSYFSLESLVEYQYDLAIGDEPVTEQEWNQLVNAKTPLVKFRGQWMELDQDKMRQMLEFWKTHQQDNPELSLLDFLKLTASSEEDGLEVEVDRQDALSDMLIKLGDKNQLQPVDNPKQFQGNLREYQKRGVSWLQYLEEVGLNGCLADDMGLGKTVQVIARLLQERELAQKKRIKNIPPTLLIAPTSVVGNWHREIQKFAPQLKAAVHHGSQRAKDDQDFKQACRENDILITSFALARKDIKLFSEIEWHRIVLDEAQNIKNPKADLTKAILKLSAPHRLALTGTPIENRLLDLWSIFNFLNPGYLGNQTQFRRSFELPIQKNNDRRQSEVLKKLVEPFILRRVKTDQAIIKDLPDKVEQKLYCNLTKEQASLYEAVVKDVEEKLKEVEGIHRKGLILATLVKLKQICNHPRQFLQDGSDFTPERSHKLSRLDEMVQEAIEEGESMLIFTQFNEIGENLEKYLRHTRHYNTYYLHGGTSRKKREQMIQEFQDPETDPSIFVLSLKAGGVGITLTKANHVFHFDRWWNPAVEDQATDRAFRIGQKKNVFVHKFVATGTLEERIDEMIEDKKKLAGSIVGSDESWLTELDNDAFKDLIALNKNAIME